MASCNDPEEIYELVEKIGQGSFGEVYKAVVKRTSKLVAVKLIDLEDAKGDIEEFRREIRILSQLNSPYIVEYYNSFLHGSLLWMVMEYLEGGSIKELISYTGPFSEEAAAVCLKEILLGLSYFHKEGRLHRDIKAANILLSSEGHVKLADFGVSEQVTKTMRKRNTFVGTPFWMAPEVIEASYYDQKADIWSFGITALEIVHGRPPWSNVHPMKALFLITKSDPPRLVGNFSESFKDFVVQCLQKDADQRSNAETLLKHPFITEKRNTNALKELLQEKRQLQRQTRLTKSSGKVDRRRKLPSSDLDFAWDFGTVKTLKKDFGGTTIIIQDHEGTIQELKVTEEDNIRDGTTQQAVPFEADSTCRVEWKGGTVRSVQLNDGTVLKVESTDSLSGGWNSSNGTIIERSWNRTACKEDSQSFEAYNHNSDTLISREERMHCQNNKELKTRIDTDHALLYTPSTKKHSATKGYESFTSEEESRSICTCQKKDAVLCRGHESNHALVDAAIHVSKFVQMNTVTGVYGESKKQTIGDRSDVVYQSKGSDIAAYSVFQSVISPLLESYQTDDTDEPSAMEELNIAVTNLENAFLQMEKCYPGFSSEFVDKLVFLVQNPTSEHVRNVLPERLRVSISPCTVDGRQDRVKDAPNESSSAAENCLQHVRRKTFA